MKLLSSIKGKKQARPMEEIEFDISVSTVDLSNSVTAPPGLATSPDAANDHPKPISNKEEKKKLKEAEKAAKVEAKAAKKEAKARAKAMKKEAKAAQKADKKRSNSASGAVPDNMEELIKEMDPEKILKVLKKIAEDDSTDTLGKECVKVIKRADRIKRQQSQSVSGRRSHRQSSLSPSATPSLEHDCNSC
jgi:hypothetical protein